MDLSGSLLKIKRGILLFWALWFALVLLTNLMDALKALKHPLIYMKPKTSEKVRCSRSISPKRCMSGRRRSSGILGMKS